MQFQTMGINKGKVVYWVNGKSFENSENKHDGMDKAREYCLENFIDPNTILKFDSRTERDRYEYLLDLQNQGLISNLSHHFVLKVQDKFVNANGDEIPAITYETDFIYFDKTTNQRIVEDTKGSTYFLNQDFIILKKVFDKLMLDKGLFIRVIVRKGKEWVEWKIGDPIKAGTSNKKARESLREAKKQLHEQNIKENKKAREIARINELRTKEKLTSVERKRLQELEDKYKV